MDAVAFGVFERVREDAFHARLPLCEDGFKKVLLEEVGRDQDGIGENGAQRQHDALGVVLFEGFGW